MEHQRDTRYIEDFTARAREVLEELPDLRLEFMPLFINLFLADDNVQAMDTEQIGAYLLLLMRGWLQRPPASIPQDDKVLAAWAKVPARRWAKIKDDVLKPFDVGPDGRLYQKRLCREWLNSVQNYLGRKRGADITNRKRRGQQADAEHDGERDGERDGDRAPQRDAQRTHKPNHTQPHQTKPNPEGREGEPGGNTGEGPEDPGGAGGSSARGRAGENAGNAGGGNIADEFRRSVIVAVLVEAGVNRESIDKLQHRRDLTPEFVRQTYEQLRRDPSVGNIPALLVHRLNSRAERVSAR